MVFGRKKKKLTPWTPREQKVLFDGDTASPDESNALPINDKRRYHALVRVYLWLYWTPFNLWRRRTPWILGKKFYLKAPHHDLAEAHTINFVREHTSIPVPKVYCSYRNKETGKTYMLMERVKGREIHIGWDERSPENQKKLLDQLKEYMRQLRSIPVPDGIGVANYAGDSISDARFINRHDRHGPFSSIDEFHKYLRYGATECFEQLPEMQPVFDLHKNKYPVCFTHGDLTCINIMADKDNITGIIDWDTAGWLPIYWEYAQAMVENPWTDHWNGQVEHYLTPYPTESHAEMLRRTIVGGAG